MERGLDPLLFPGGGSFPAPHALLLLTAGSATVSDIRVVETDYEEYALLAGEKQKGGETFLMVTLYGRGRLLPVAPPLSLVQLWPGWRPRAAGEASIPPTRLLFLTASLCFSR